MKAFRISAWIAALALVCCLPAAQADREIHIVTIADAISPGVAEFLIDALDRADADNAACLIIALDTPGGLAESMRKIVQAMYAAKAPVIVYVMPEGARAASAGVMITMAADIAAMAPGTNIGAAHPVGAGGSDIEGAMSKKVINDMVAFAKGIANRRGRNEQWVEEAIRESVSITAQEAVDKKVVDLVADDMDDLIAKLDGREIKEKGKLAVDGLAQREIKEDLRIRVLKTISNPNIAYILLMIGLAGLYFELSHPGAIFPGVVGGIALILAFFALQTLPVNTAGILLILLSIILFILELKVVSYGMLSVAGVVTLLLGSLMLFKGAGPQFQVAWRVFVPTVALISGFFITLIYLVVKAHKDRPQTGADGLVGEIGVVQQVDNGRGKVLVHGELWQAVFEKPAAAGARVKIVAVDRLVVTAAPLESIESAIS
jgi:membrane-bound serine protease (ClpP class)